MRSVLVKRALLPFPIERVAYVKRPVCRIQLECINRPTESSSCTCYLHAAKQNAEHPGITLAMAMFTNAVGLCIKIGLN